ncbi:unnamed protein product, partial [Closterium sp. NIES-65]
RQGPRGAAVDTWQLAMGGERPVAVPPRGGHELSFHISFHNTTRKQEIFIPHVTASVVLLSSHYLHGISTHVSAARLDVHYPAYGPHGSLPLVQHVILPLAFPPCPPPSAPHAPSVAQVCPSVAQVCPSVAQVCLLSSLFSLAPTHPRRYSSSPLLHRSPPSNAHSPCLHTVTTASRPPPLPNSIAPGISVLAVPTHLLCHLDDPLHRAATVRRAAIHYAAPYLQPGDVVTLGETPLAIMQGRFRHPDSLCAGPVARWACRRFLPTSSLATACGMQALIDVVGVVRVIVAVLLAALARLLLGKRGVFYQLAGEQARLIDDVTGTLPPYDQFITLGPVRGLSSLALSSLALSSLALSSLALSCPHTYAF